MLNKISDLEIHNRNLKNSCDEVTNNYENLLKTHKTAEKMNELQKKIQHLVEEKSTLSESNRLIVDSLTKDIKELNEKLNEYRRKEKIELNVNEIKENEGGKSKEIYKIYFILQIDFITEQKVENSQDIITTVSDSSLGEGKGENKLVENIPQTPQNLGFFTRILAPIFLTERELETINKK